MLKKERWIVYPLLMLSLFSSLDLGVQVIKAQQEVLDLVVTKELRVVNDEGETVASISHTEGNGTSLILDYGNRRAVIAASNLGSEVFLLNGLKVIRLSSFDEFAHLNIIYEQHSTQLTVTPEDGFLEFRGPKLIEYLVLGGNEKSGGYLYTNNIKGDRRASLYQTASGHGGLWLYDKYGEKSKGYTY